MILRGDKIDDSDLNSVMSTAPHSESVIFVFLCILPIFATIFFGAVDNTTWIIITLLTAVIVLFWIYESWKSERIAISSNLLQLPMLGLIVIGLVHLLPIGPPGDVGRVLAVSASDTLSLDPYATRFFLTRLVIYIVFFAGCLTFINNESRFKRVVIAVIIFGAAMAFFGILQRLANPDGIYGVRETPQAVPFGPFVNQHHFAAFMQMTGGLTLGLLFSKVIKRDRKILLGMAFVLMTVAVILTSSRGGLLGLLSVVTLVLIFQLISSRWRPSDQSTVRSSKVGRNAAAAAIALSSILVIVGIVLFIGGGDSLLRGIGASQIGPDLSSGRSHFWSIALQMFLDHPGIGVGFDAFGVAFTRYDTWSGLFRVEQAHNEYLQMLAESGLLGFACLATFIYSLFRESLQTISQNAGIISKGSIGALAGCFGILIHSFFDFPLRTPSNAFFFLLLCSLAVFKTLRHRDLPNSNNNSFLSTG